MYSNSTEEKEICARTKPDHQRRGTKAHRHWVCTRSAISRMARERSGREEEEWEIEGMYRLHRSQQGLPKRFFSSTTHRHASRCYSRP